MTDLSHMSIRDIALESPATIPVFEEYRIDYCCRGRRVLDDACRDAGIDTAELVDKLGHRLNFPPEDHRTPETMSLTDLIDHIVERHHVFTREELDGLSELMSKVVAKHGDKHFELHELHRKFGELYVDLVPHMQKEETVLFPYIVRLHASATLGASKPIAAFETVQVPISAMLTEHETVGEVLEEMRRLTNDYALPNCACQSFQSLYQRLQELEKDLHLHIHIENNILFPRAIELEQALSRTASSDVQCEVHW